MRGIFIAMLLAMGIGLVGTANSGAAPLSGAALLNGLQDLSTTEQAQYWRYRYGSRRTCVHRYFSGRRCWHR
jgi:hypothetical protein